MISRSCETEGISTVGPLKEITCRTPRKCGSCGNTIIILDRLYTWSMYDFDTCQTCTPWYMCEKCGDLTYNLM